MTTYWKEMAEGWEVTQDIESGIVATRRFHDQGTTSGALPAIGSSMAGAKGAILATIVKTKIGGHGGKQFADLSYKANLQNVSTSATTSLPRRLEIGGEMLTIGGGNQPTGWYWENSTPCLQTIAKRIITGNYSIEERITDSVMNFGASSGKCGKIIANAGKVNSSSWQGQAKGSWLYLGADAERQKSSSGGIVWHVSHKFGFRRIPGQTDDHWQYVWNPEMSAWYHVSYGLPYSTSRLLYPYSSSFNALFKGSLS